MSHIKKNIKKSFVIIGNVMLLVVVTFGVTYALISIKKEKKYTFVEGMVECRVQNDYSIVNTGNINSYIRATVIVNLIDEAGNIYKENPEYDLILGENWVLNADDGYYYYNLEIAPNEYTTALINEIIITNSELTNYTKNITILAESMQISNDNKAINDAWK